ncbi:MAG: response regulator transcription factor [Nocardioides sp.]
MLFLTALDQQHERLAGFSAGADDYVTKPFDTAELLARVGVLTRRHHEQLAHRSRRGPGPGPDAPHRPDHRRVRLLTLTEFRILASITARRGDVVRRRAVVAAGWPDGAIVHENTLDSFLRRLRRKLESIGAGNRIETVRGVGFRLT